MKGIGVSSALVAVATLFTSSIAAELDPIVIKVSAQIPNSRVINF